MYNQYNQECIANLPKGVFAAGVAAADIAVARSGAASLTELSYFGLPSVLIPYPYAAEDHQTFNAKIFSSVGAAVLVQEREADGPFLAAEITRKNEVSIYSTNRICIFDRM